MARRVCIVSNPRAGHATGGRRDLEEAAARLEAAGWEVRVEQTTGPGQATAIARACAQKGFDMVVAAGGDGTANEVLNGMVGSGAVLGVLPLGTTNVWAREVGIPLAIPEAAEVLLDGEIREVDVGLAGNRHFLLMAGVGFDGEVLRTLDPEAKRWLGISAYLLAGALASLTFRGTTAEIELDQKKLPRCAIQMLVLGNTRLYAFVEVTPEARMDDGMLDVCIFKGREGPFTRARHLLAVLLGRHIRSPGVDYARASRVVVRTDKPMPVQADGDYIGQTPMEFGVLRRGVRVVLPRASRSGLFSNGSATA